MAAGGVAVQGMKTERMHVLGTWVHVPAEAVERCRLAEEQAKNDPREIGCEYDLMWMCSGGWCES